MWKVWGTSGGSAEDVDCGRCGRRSTAKYGAERERGKLLKRPRLLFAGPALGGNYGTDTTSTGLITGLMDSKSVFGFSWNVLATLWKIYSAISILR